MRVSNSLRTLTFPYAPSQDRHFCHCFSIIVLTFSVSDIIDEQYHLFFPYFWDIQLLGVQVFHTSNTCVASGRSQPCVPFTRVIASLLEDLTAALPVTVAHRVEFIVVTNSVSRERTSSPPSRITRLTYIGLEPTKLIRCSKT